MWYARDSKIVFEDDLTFASIDIQGSSELFRVKESNKFFLPVL